LGTPERKKLGELYKNFDRPDASFPPMDKVQKQLDNLLKDWQVLSAEGVAVHQECSRVASNIQGALRTLQTNAAANARKKMSSTRTKGKFF
jgi:hypothetical protein